MACVEEHPSFDSIQLEIPKMERCARALTPREPVEKSSALVWLGSRIAHLVGHPTAAWLIGADGQRWIDQGRIDRFPPREWLQLGSHVEHSAGNDAASYRYGLPGRNPCFPPLGQQHPGGWAFGD